MPHAEDVYLSCDWFQILLTEENVSTSRAASCVNVRLYLSREWTSGSRCLSLYLITFRFWRMRKDAVCSRREMYQYPGRLPVWMSSVSLMSLISDSDECAKTPCAHGGKCINIQGGFLCECTSGSRCLYLTWFIFRFWRVCQDTVCPRREVYQHPGWLPVWLYGWQSMFISRVIIFRFWRVCQDAVCPRREVYQHPGRLPVWMSSVYLMCLFLDSDECAKTPCAHGGKCINIQGGFLCDCTPGWQGRTCEDSAYSLFSQIFLWELLMFSLKLFQKWRNNWELSTLLAIMF